MNNENKYPQTVFITGVSSGFGFLLTAKLLKNNYRVIGGLRGGETRGRTLFVEHQNEILTKQLVFIDLDLIDSQSMTLATEKIFKLSPSGLDVLINNAGIAVLGPIEMQKESDIREELEVNFFAPLLLIQKLLPLLKKARGKIINVSSMACFAGFPFYGTYAASKSAIDVLTEGLYYDLNVLGVQVCSVLPGAFKTNILKVQKVVSATEAKATGYESRLQKFEKFLKDIVSKSEKDPHIVVEEIFQLCQAKKIPLRLRIGIDAKFVWRLHRLSPTLLRIKIQDWLYRKFFF